MHNKEFLAHIGFPKCASSTLQSELFKINQENELISPSQLGNVTGNIFIQPVNSKTELHYQILDYLNGTKINKINLKNAINSIIKKSKSRTIFSSEWVTACRYVKNEPYERIKLFSELVPKSTKIILVVRDHLDLILSLYRDNQLTF